MSTASKESAQPNDLQEVGRTPSGYTIYRQPNGVGGHSYWSDEIGGGVHVWDTCLVGDETLRACLEIEASRIASEDAQRSSSGGKEDADLCPICAEPLKPDDICATDISEGICHAACLEGSPVVDLDTGEETGGKADTYRYGDVAEPSVPKDREP
ncbi:hypothetical protein [Ancylobacter sp. IITR112]|uniref:hypothetical protein n=1 Tax=Ancylobacter sp. IITR112 TaxID=3138073 RepID=UPI00352AD05A